MTAIAAPVAVTALPLPRSSCLVNEGRPLAAPRDEVWQAAEFLSQRGNEAAFPAFLEMPDDLDS